LTNFHLVLKLKINPRNNGLLGSSLYDGRCNRDPSAIFSETDNRDLSTISSEIDNRDLSAISSEIDNRDLSAISSDGYFPKVTEMAELLRLRSLLKGLTEYPDRNKIATHRKPVIYS